MGEIKKIFELDAEDDVWLAEEIESLLQAHSKGKVKVTELSRNIFIHIDRDPDITYVYYDRKKRLKITVCRHCGQNVSVTKVPKKGAWVRRGKGWSEGFYESPGLPGEEG